MLDSPIYYCPSCFPAICSISPCGTNPPIVCYNEKVEWVASGTVRESPEKGLIVDLFLENSI